MKKNNQVFIPPPNADKAFGGGFGEGFVPSNMLEALFGRPGIPAQSANRSIFFTWKIPTLFIAVDPEISIYWMNEQKEPIEIDWVLKYQYLNESSWLGYFDEAGMPVMTFDDGRSEVYTTTFKASGVAEKSIIQETPPHGFIKKDRRSGSLVIMELQTELALEEVYILGAQINFSEHPRVREPIGRKRTRKKRWYDDDPYPYGG